MRKRSKRSRLRGRRTCGWGSRKKHRGKGSRGGKGMAGTGKRAGHRRTWVLRYMPNYFGRRGFVSLKQKRKVKLKLISLAQLSSQLELLAKEGFVKHTEKGFEVELKGYKVLSQGKIEQPLIVKASSFSKGAEQKIKEAGGQALIV